MSVTEYQEAKRTPEAERVVEYCLVFDVDGVLTDPVRKEVTTPEVLAAIAARLRRGDPVILNTGRAVDFVREKIITPLVSTLGSRTFLRHSVVVAEKGGVVMYFDSTRAEHTVIDETISVHAEIRTAAERVVAERYAGSMFVDTTKRTMVSIEMHTGYDLERFHQAQSALVAELERLVAGFPARHRLQIDPTTIATDVQDTSVGKAWGVHKALWWLGEQGITPKEFLTFGDSQSDLAMAEELARLNKPTKFVFVGDRGLSAEEAPFPIVKTSRPYEAGVVEFLRQLE